MNLSSLLQQLILADLVVVVAVVVVVVDGQHVSDWDPRGVHL